MADLPPLAEVPEQLAGPTDGERHRAEWAGFFGGSDVNLAQRYRHNADINAYAESLERERAAQQQQQIATNKTAQDLWIRSRQLEIQRASANAALAERQQRMEHAEAILPATLQAKDAQTRASLAKERAITVAEQLKAKAESRAAEDTANFSQHMSELMDRTNPGSDDYKLGILRGITAFPHADKALVKQYGAPALEDQDLQEVLKTVPAGFDVAGIRRDANGRWTVAAKSESAGELASLEKERTALERRLARAEQTKAEGMKYGKNGTSLVALGDEGIAEYKPQLQAVQQKIAALRGGNSQQAPAEPAQETPGTSAPAQNVTKEQYDAIPSGGKYWWNGKQLTKK